MRWTKSDIEYLKEYYPSKTSLQEILNKLKRTKRAVCHKAVRMGLSRLKIATNRPKNRDHRRIYDHTYYHKNKKKLVMMKRKRLRNRKLEFIKLLGGKCVVCGYDKCLQALEFHHIKGNKEGEVSKIITDFSKQKALKEIKKCISLCANCHRELHSKGV